MRPDTNQRPDTGHDAAASAAAAQTRVTTLASESGPRAAAEHATTEYARGAFARVADLHAALALSHDDHAKALRLPLRRAGVGDGE
jgi:hypothetical protein